MGFKIRVIVQIEAAAVGASHIEVFREFNEGML
jgi:hypothetical protein